MRTVMDAAGRVTIPLPLRRAAAFAAGQELEVTERDGRIEIEAVPVAMRLVERDGFLAAEIDQHDVTLTVAGVRHAVEQTRR